MSECKYHTPPWIIFNPKNNDGTVHILPAGRPGCVIKDVPHELAKLLVDASNFYIQYKIKQAFQSLRDRAAEILQKIKDDKENG